MRAFGPGQRYPLQQIAFPLPAPLPSDYWHVSNDKYSASVYAPQQGPVSLGTASYSVPTGSIVAAPFFVGRRGRTVSALGAYFTNTPTAGNQFKIVIYDCLPPADHNVYPQNLVASAVVTLTANIGVQTAALVSPVTLPNGLYWIVCGRLSGAGGQNILAFNGTGANFLAGRSPLQWNVNTLQTLLTAVLANATPLPDPFSAGATTLTTSNPLFEVL
jgi:hypothetical protein